MPLSSLGEYILRKREQEKKLLLDQVLGSNPALPLPEVQAITDNLLKTGKLPPMLPTGQNEVAKFSSPLNVGGGLPPMMSAPTNTPVMTPSNLLLGTPLAKTQEPTRPEVFVGEDRKAYTYDPQSGEFKPHKGQLPANATFKQLPRPEKKPAEKETDQEKIYRAILNKYFTTYKAEDDEKLRQSAVEAATYFGFDLDTVAAKPGEKHFWTKDTPPTPEIKKPTLKKASPAVAYLRKNYPSYPETPANIKWALGKLNAATP